MGSFVPQRAENLQVSFRSKGMLEDLFHCGSQCANNGCYIAYYCYKPHTLHITTTLIHKAVLMFNSIEVIRTLLVAVFDLTQLPVQV